MSSPTETTLPLRTRSSTAPCPKCPHRLSDYASEHTEQPSTLPSPSPKTKTKTVRFEQFPTPTFSSAKDEEDDESATLKVTSQALQDLEASKPTGQPSSSSPSPPRGTSVSFHQFPNPTVASDKDNYKEEEEEEDEPLKEEWVTLVALKEATSQALTEQEENSAPAVNEDEEEDHAEREWVKLCTLKDLEGRIEEMLDEHVIVPTRWEGLRDERLRRGSVEPLVESVKAVEKRREAPSPRKGILRAKTDDLIVRKKKSVRFEEERARSESDEPVVIKKKKTVRFSDSEDEGSGRQSRTAWYEVEGSNLWR